MTALDAFHFLRPLWLMALPAIAVLWWSIRAAHRSTPPSLQGIAPHLRSALTIGQTRRVPVQPIDGVALALVCLALGVAGPTWSRQPDPFVAQSAPLVIALKVAPSMTADDLAPTRLERAKQKIRDLLELRAGAATALVAYAGSAHVVVPMTGDPGVMLPYLDGLSPEVMPKEGDQAGEALTLAGTLLERQEVPGGVLFVTDAVDPADKPVLAGDERVAAVLAMLPADVALPEGLGTVPVLGVTPDANDIARIDRLLDAAYRQAMLENEDQPWQDRGPWMAWPAVMLILLSFRRGWTMRWAAIATLALASGMGGGPARADGMTDWFLTPDQQGRLAFQRKDFDRAAELFEDPLWRGYALYRDGQYPEAVQVLDRVETAEAAFIQGNAHIRNRAYRDGMRAFETVLARDPDYPGAAENLAVAQQIVDFVEEQREQSDTGEDQGIGADEVVFDNEENRGADTQMEVPEDSDGGGLLSADQWMRMVDTRPGDFLKQRFVLEAAQGTTATEAAE